MTVRLFEGDAGMEASPFWSKRVSSFYHLSQKRKDTVTQTQHSTHVQVQCSRAWLVGAE